MQKIAVANSVISHISRHLKLNSLYQSLKTAILITLICRIESPKQVTIKIHGLDENPFLLQT